MQQHSKAPTLVLLTLVLLCVSQLQPVCAAHSLPKPPEPLHAGCLLQQWWLHEVETTFKPLFGRLDIKEATGGTLHEYLSEYMPDAWARMRQVWLCAIGDASGELRRLYAVGLLSQSMVEQAALATAHVVPFHASNTCITPNTTVLFAELRAMHESAHHLAAAWARLHNNSTAEWDTPKMLTVMQQLFHPKPGQDQRPDVDLDVLELLWEVDDMGFYFGEAQKEWVHRAAVDMPREGRLKFALIASIAGLRDFHELITTPTMSQACGDGAGGEAWYDAATFTLHTLAKRCELFASLEPWEFVASGSGGQAEEEEEDDEYADEL